MTICIGALCDRGQACVVAADREITIGFPMNIEFEHHEQKIDILSDSCVVLGAGNALVAEETITRTRRLVVAEGALEVARAAELLRDSFMALHIERAEQVILTPRGLTLTEYRATGAQQLTEQLYHEIDQLFWNFSLSTEFLVAGSDKSGAHIAWVHYHGIQGMGWLEWFDKLGYQTTGSGGSHAAILLALTGQHRDLTIAETIYNVYCAKVNAEVAPGVGDATDMAIITATGIETLDTAFLGRLEDARNTAMKRIQPDVEALFADRKPATD